MSSPQLHSWIHRWTNRSLKERVSDHRNQTTSTIRNYNFTKHAKSVLEDFTIIDTNSNTLHHQTKEALHICIKDPSLNRKIGKVRIPSVFNKLHRPHILLEQPHSSIPHLMGAPSSLGLSKQLHTFLISIYNRNVIPLFKLFKLQDNWIFRSPPSKKYNRKQFLHITWCHLLQKVFKLQVHWSTHHFINQGWRRK